MSEEHTDGRSVGVPLWGYYGGIAYGLAALPISLFEALTGEWLLGSIAFLSGAGLILTILVLGRRLGIKGGQPV